jgi:cyclopropane fatty-acyl-phospholipid synthase-like methyltransferase
MANSPFNEDYYESGPEKGVSCYSNYQWLPERTISAVMTCIDYLEIKRGEGVLDFGCAKGYYVKAFRLLHRDAWGCDISEYAISKADSETKPFVSLIKDTSIPFQREFDYIIAKDVLEHMTESQVCAFLDAAKNICSKKMLVIVPLAVEGKYIIPEDELDITHILRSTQEEWIERFDSNGWEIQKAANQVPGIKDHQAKYKNGVGFFTLVRRS